MAPGIALATAFGWFLGLTGILTVYSLNGEWSIAANLTAETWPAKHRSKVLSGTRSLYGLRVILGMVGYWVLGWIFKVEYSRRTLDSIRV